MKTPKISVLACIGLLQAIQQSVVNADSARLPSRPARTRLRQGKGGRNLAKPYRGKRTLAKVKRAKSNTKGRAGNGGRRGGGSGGGRNGTPPPRTMPPFASFTESPTQSPTMEKPIGRDRGDDDYSYTYGYDDYDYSYSPYYDGSGTGSGSERGSGSGSEYSYEYDSDSDYDDPDSDYDDSEDYSYESEEYEPVYYYDDFDKGYYDDYTTPEEDIPEPDPEMWNIPCEQVNLEGTSGTVTISAASFVPQKCWDVSSPDGTYIHMDVQLLDLLYLFGDKNIWDCNEHDEEVESLTVRNRPPSQYEFAEDDYNLLLLTCSKGKYRRIITDRETAHFRLSRLDVSPSDRYNERYGRETSIEINYKVFDCSTHPGQGCSSKTAYPTSSSGRTKFPTSTPTKPPTPSNECTMIELDSSPKHFFKGELEISSIEENTDHCWSADFPSSDGSGVLIAEVEIDGLYVNPDMSCSGSLAIVGVYTNGKTGRKLVSESKQIYGDLCGTYQNDNLNIPLSNNDLELAHVEFRLVSTRAQADPHVLVRFSYLADEIFSDTIVEDFAGLKNAIMNQEYPSAKQHRILIDTDILYFHDSWDCLLEYNVIIKPAPGRDVVVFDGSRKVRPTYSGLQEELVPFEDVKPQICLVDTTANVAFENVHFRFFKMQNTRVNESVGLIHVLGSLSVRGCKFSSNDARPIVDEQDDIQPLPNHGLDLALPYYPKGSVIQVVGSGIIKEIIGSTFFNNRHTVIGNRGYINVIDQCTFLNNDATEQRSLANGSLVRSIGAIIANSYQIEILGRNRFEDNKAQALVYHSPYAISSDEVHFNPQ